MDRVVDQAAHLQAGEQLAPGLHWHAGPHLQAGERAHDSALLGELAPAVDWAESAVFMDGFI